MYEKLKNDMRAAGISVSEGNDLAQTDLQLARDFLYFQGIVLTGDNFDVYDPEAATVADPSADEDLKDGPQDPTTPEEPEPAADIGESSDQSTEPQDQTTPAEPEPATNEGPADLSAE